MFHDLQFTIYNFTILQYTIYNFTILQFTIYNSAFLQFQSSSCLSDKDEDDIYDFAAKYEGAGKHHIFWNGNKPRISPG